MDSNKNLHFVLFRNLLEEEAEDLSLGVKMPDNTVLCLCCGGTFEEEDFQVVEEITACHLPNTKKEAKNNEC